MDRRNWLTALYYTNGVDRLNRCVPQNIITVTLIIFSRNYYGARPLPVYLFISVIVFPLCAVLFSPRHSISPQHIFSPFQRYDISRNLHQPGRSGKKRKYQKRKLVPSTVNICIYTRI